MSGSTHTGHRPEVEGERERLLRALFNQLPALIAYWDHDCRNVVANAAYVEWFGFTPDDMVGRHISEILGSEVYAKNLPFIEGALAGNEQLFDRTLVDRAGQVRHTQASYVPDVLDGVVHGFFVLVTDVTPRVEAQRSMDDAQASAKLGSWSLDVASGELTWSDELHRIVGVGQGESDMSIETLSGLIHPDDRERVLDNIAGASRRAASYSIAYRIVRPSGEVVEVVSTGQSVADPDGMIVRLTGTMQDVTEVNRTAREVARINLELRDANQLNADVIGMLGHDISSPLTSILGLSEILDSEWATFEDDERRAMVRRITGAAGRMRELVESILTLAAVDAGSIRPVTESLDLAETLRVVLADLPGGDRVEVVVSEGLRPVLFDRVHLGQVVHNLVNNAFRYGAEPVRITVSPALDHVLLAVEDGGAGVPVEAVPALFDRFARTGRSQELAGGTGFGLYITSRLARANGASIAYRPAEPDRRHQFLLTLPLGPPAAGKSLASSRSRGETPL